MQSVSVALKHDPDNLLRFGPFLSDDEALAFVKAAKENKHIRTAFRSDLLPPDTLTDYLPTEE